MKKLSYSSMALYQECRRKYQYQKVLGIYPRKRPGYYLLGEAVHKYLEHYYKQLPNPMQHAMSVFENADKSMLTPEQVHDMEIDKAIVGGICTAYPSHYDMDLAQYTKFITEQQFELKMEGFAYHGYIDMLVQDAAGDWWVFETKTVAAQRMNANFLDRIRIDWQVLSYIVAAKKILGVWPKGVIYNMIKKPGIRLRKGEGLNAFLKRVAFEYTKYGQTKSYFTREEVLVDKTALSQWLTMANKLGQEITNQDHESEDPWIMNPGACLSNWGVCPYFECCVTNKVNPILYVQNKPKD